MQETFLAGLSNDALRALPYLFEFWALPHQLPPEGDWKTWVILGGRGAGKTRAGAEWVRSMVEGSRPEDAGMARRVALVGETLDQARDVMVMGESGILACSPPDRRPRWEATRRRLVWPNGAVAEIYSAHDFERLRGPQFDAAWADELGCPAVDKGTNAPGRRINTDQRDSSGARDDLLQARFLDAVASYWEDPERNPLSPVYGGPMVATDRMFFWGWDARPYPQFPASVSIWSDGADYGSGHVLAGRMASRSLAAVVEEVCAASGLTDVDVSGLYGLVRGVSVEGGRDARAALQPLLLAAGADAVERDGRLVFRSRTPRVTATLSRDELVWAPGADVVTHLRDAQSAVAGRVQLDFLEADGDYEVRAAEARFPDAEESVVARSELPLVLTQGEGRSLTERWLTEVRVARESVRFVLPPSSTLAAGDVVAFEGETDGARYRIDRIEEGGERRVEAVRIDTGTFASAADAETIVARPPVLAPLPVASEIMDLPLIVGEEAVAAPWVVAASEPWPGTVAVYMQRGPAWRFEAELSQRALIGETLNTLPWAAAHRFDRGPALRVRLVAGTLSSIDEAALFTGGNAALIRSAAGGDWEVFQFRDAVLSEPDVWDLSMRLRGQQGTDASMPASYPSGSRLVIVDGALRQVSLRANYLGQPQLFRIGPANKPVDHPSFTTIDATTFGLGFRPYAPAHLRARADTNGDVAVTWVRRTRIDGDRWEPLDVPLGEVAESYQVRVLVGTSLRREVIVASPAWTYSAAERAADGVTGAYRIEVAQISDRFGPGLFGKVEIND